MPDFQPISEVINLFFPFPNHDLLYWSGSLLFFCKIQCLLLVLGQSPTTLQAQILPWDSISPLWLNWCLDMLHCWRWKSVNLAMSLPSVLAWVLYFIHWY
jgi:hypothetical protein